jgi:photosystem II stability/assembly factor-like uncharacterized protein
MKRLPLLLLAALVCLCNTSFAQYKYWEQLNGPSGGYVFSIAVDSTQRVIVGSAASGIFTSTNKGDTWRALNRGLRTLRIKRVESGPDAYVYMIDLDNQFARFHDVDIGWEFIIPWENPTSSYLIHDIHVNPQGTIFVAAQKYGIRRSTDHGTTWQWSQWFQDDTTRKKMIFRRLAATMSGDTLYALTDSGYVYRSIDKGDSWTRSAVKHPRAAVVKAESFEVSRGGDLIIASQRDIPGGKFYRSTDGGDSWTLVFEHPFDHVAYSLVRSNANGDMYASTHSPPDSKDQTRIGGIFYSTDNGANWVLRDDAEHGDDKFYMAVNGDGDIFHGSVPGGVEMSMDHGFTWPKKNDGLYVQFLHGAAVNSSGHLFAITPFTMYRSTTGGQQWKELNTVQIESFFESVLRITTGDVVYHGSFYGLYRSSDNGDHWTHVIEGDTNNPNNFFYDMQEAPNGWLYASSAMKGLMVSKNNGLDWEKVPNLPASLIVMGITFAGLDTVLISTELTNCWLSTNGGINWVEQKGTLSAAKSLVHHPAGYFVALLAHEVKVSTDAGDSWEKVFPTPALDTLNDWEMFSMLIDRQQRILVSTDSGIWLSEVPFTNWEQRAFGMTTFDYRYDQYAIASQMVQDKQTGIIYASTRGQSMYRTRNPDMGVKLSPSVAVATGQNFPNPFKELTSLQIAIDEGGYGELEIFTSLGERVMHEAKGNLLPGDQTFSFDGSDLASGNYLYCLKVDGKPVARGWMQVVH